MGAWGAGNFDNDTACDWAYELEESSDLSVIENSIDAVFEEEYIDADIGCEALAAIDTVARVIGKPGTSNSYTETVDKWVAENKVTISKELLDKAVKALDQIAGDDSELFELWSESDELGNWQNELKALKKRLSA